LQVVTAVLGPKSNNFSKMDEQTWFQKFSFVHLCCKYFIGLEYIG
jgi:hypothetical protein